MNVHNYVIVTAKMSAEEDQIWIFISFLDLFMSFVCFFKLVDLYIYYYYYYFFFFFF